jgi:hypothetical protein
MMRGARPGTLVMGLANTWLRVGGPAPAPRGAGTP